MPEALTSVKACSLKGLDVKARPLGAVYWLERIGK